MRLLFTIAVKGMRQWQRWHMSMSHIHAAGLAGAEDPTAEVLRMSALNEEGVMSVRSAACDRLLASRVDLKLKVLF